MQTTARPMANSQPVNGSNNTSNIPSPRPIKHTPKVFFNTQNIIYYLLLVYYINIIMESLLK